MPTPQMKSYSEKYNVPLEVIEEFWSTAKKEYGDDYAAISGTVKKMAQNYKKSKRECVMNNIEKSLSSLQECKCDGKCDKKKCKCGDKCKCKAKKDKEEMDEM